MVISFKFLPSNDFLTVFPHIKSLENTFHSAVLCQGKPRITIYTNFEELESLTLHAKFEELLVLRKKILKGFYHIYGHPGLLGHDT